MVPTEGRGLANEATGNIIMITRVVSGEERPSSSLMNGRRRLATDAPQDVVGIEMGFHLLKLPFWE